MNILGIHCGHNSSAALMSDGVVIGAVQEERFTKRKNQVAFPMRAIRHLVDVHLGGDVGKIDRVALAGKVVDPTGLAVARYSEFDVADHIQENHDYWYGVFYEGRPNDGRYWTEMFKRGEKLNHDHNVDVDKMMAMPLADAFRYMSEVERQEAMRRYFGWDGPYDALDHHACHAHYAFYGQPIPAEYWNDVLILTADALGDHRDWSVSTVNADGTLHRIEDGTGNSVARIYRFVTLILGMKPNEHEYKVMGLSAYSKSSKHIAATEQVFYDLLDFRDGQFVRNKPLKESYFDLKDRLEGHRFDNIAAALQNWATGVTRSWVSHWLKRTGKSRLCFSGGLSMNIKMNGELAEMPELKGLYVPASGGDESNPIGACFMAQKQLGKPVRPLTHVYLGTVNPHDVENDWKEGLRRAGVSTADYDVATGFDRRAIAKLLAAGHIVARCVGPMEFGARALGNRSILADPSSPDNIKRINDAIKARDFWMPFTPSIKSERAADYLVIPNGIVSPYMTIGYQSTPLGRKEIIAALHPGDFSARPQFVTREANAEYWALISEFEALTGIGALLNTSLNLHGDPMNATIADATRTLALSALDFLALPGDRLLYRKSAASILGGIAEPLEAAK